MNGLIVLTAFFACSGGTHKVDAPDSGQEDLDGPIIGSTPLGNPQYMGSPLTITADITDEAGEVQDARVFFKEETLVTWDHVGMSEVKGSTWEGTIPPESLGSGGMDYYIWAVDDSLNETFLPEHGADDPYHFRLDSAQ